MTAQIAGFHNTIGDRMVTSQRPMMLEAALGLSSLVREGQEGMTWENAEQVRRLVVILGTFRNFGSFGPLRSSVTSSAFASTWTSWPGRTTGWRHTTRR